MSILCDLRSVLPHGHINRVSKRVVSVYLFPRLMCSVVMRTLLSQSFIALSILFMSGLVAGCGGDGSPPSENIEVRDFRYVEQPNGDREFSADVHNTGSENISIVQLEVTLFDQTGAQIGTQQIEVEDIPANGSRSFTQPLTHAGAVGQARVSSVMVP